VIRPSGNSHLFLTEGCSDVAEEDLEEIVHVLLDMMPNEISNKDLSIVVIKFRNTKKMEDRWPIISMAIDKILTEHLIMKSLVESKNIRDAVNDADDFRKGMQ
jgi:hypothetical protein